MLSNRGLHIVRQSNALSFRLLSSTATTQAPEGAPAQSKLSQTQGTTGNWIEPRICVEGYQGTTEPIPVKKAKKLLSRALIQSQIPPGIQGIQGDNHKTAYTIFQCYHTSTHRPLVQEPRSSFSADSENSFQGIQGDDCINFKLWMESCRRYGLENCDQQLQGIQTGRKTLSQVLSEQDELIRSISEKYRQEASAQRQGESSMQGLQGSLDAFPSVNAPCPQGVQGEDCIRFKLWLENCHRFGFSECMDQLESMSSGRKSLGQVFAEQDQLIRSVVNRYQQKRGYSTSASDPKSADPQVGGSSDTKLTQREQLKRTVKEYGASAIVFHIGISLVSLGGFYVAVSRKNDYENYLICLLLPGATQRAAFAIRAFNVELAQVRDTVSEKERGLLRMQFWKDTIEEIYQGSAPNTPVATELAGAVHHFKLNKKWLTRIIEARASNLSDQGYRNIAEVEQYAENSVSSVSYLLLQCLGVQNVHADHAASHIGKAQGLVTLLRSTPYHASKSRVYLPLDLLVKHKVSQEKILRGSDDQSVRDLVYEVASSAHVHLQTARSFKKDVPKDSSIVFLNTVVCDWYLKLLQVCNFNTFDSRLQQRNSLLPFYLWLQKRRKTY